MYLHKCLCPISRKKFESLFFLKNATLGPFKLWKNRTTVQTQVMIFCSFKHETQQLCRVKQTNVMFIKLIYKQCCQLGEFFPILLEIWGIFNPMGNGKSPGELIETWCISGEFKLADIFCKLCNNEIVENS